MRFAGYAALFGRIDRGGDVIRPGAFRRSLGQVGGGSGGALPLLWQHAAGCVIGHISYVCEDARGLRVIGEIAGPGAGALAATLLASGAVRGLSFGYRVRASRGTAPRELAEVELVEVSLVTCPMQPMARVHLYYPLPLAGEATQTWQLVA